MSDTKIPVELAIRWKDLNRNEEEAEKERENIMATMWRLGEVCDCGRWDEDDLEDCMCNKECMEG